MVQRHRVSEFDDFYRVAMQSLLDLCGHSVNNQPITDLAGFLVLTVSNGDIYELSINQTSIDDSMEPSAACLSTGSSKLTETDTALENDTASGNVEVEPDVDDSSSRRCVNCGCSETGRWRLVNNETMCNACGLYFNLNGTNRPVHLQSRSKSTRRRVKKSISGLESAHEELVASPDGMMKSMDKGISARRLRDRRNDNIVFIKKPMDGVGVCADVTAHIVKPEEPIIESYVENSSPYGSAAAAAAAADNPATDMSEDEDSSSDDVKETAGLKNGNESTTILYRPRSMRTNVEEADSAKRYACPSCSGVFFSRGIDKRRHTRDHHKPYKCQRCLIDFVGQLALLEHVKLKHPGEPSYKTKLAVLVCEYCSKVYFNSSHLRDHISTHHFGIRYQCHYCNKLLASAYTRTIHEREKHQTKNMLTCEACGQQFARLASLIFHLRSTHPQLVPERYRQRFQQLHCAQCGLYFSRRSSLHRHLEVRHSDGQANHKCPMCDKAFPCRRYLLRHQRTHHAGTARDVSSSFVAKVDA